MKLIFAMLAVILIAVAGLTGCSKDGLEVQDKAQSEKYVIDDPKTYGAIEGFVSPFIKGSYVFAVNSFFQTEPVMIAQDGSFRIELNSGLYDLYIVFEVNGIPETMIIPAITVKPSTTVNIGTINLE